MKIITIEGCEYRVPDEEILAWLELYGEVLSEVQEDYFVIEEEEEFLCSDICQRAEYIWNYIFVFKFEQSSYLFSLKNSHPSRDLNPGPPQY